MPEREPKPFRTLASTQRFRLVVAWIMLAAWVTSFVAALFVRDYRPPPELNAVMLLIVSVSFGFGDRG